MTSQSPRISNKEKKSTSPWRVVTLGEVGEIVSGGPPSTTVSEYWGGDINWISPSDLTGYKKKTIKNGAKSITKLGLKNSSARMIPKGSVLFSSRAPIGYVVIAAEDLSTNQGFKSIVPHDFISSEYLYYYLKASKQLAENVASGTTFKEISKSKFSELQIPVPSLDIQKAIVSKIEELFSELDKGIESLKMAQQKLKVYRQSILKWAFEGRLTNENVKEGELPQGWNKRKLAELVEKISDGPFGSHLKTSDYVQSGVRVIRLENIGVLEFKNEYKTYITPEKYETIKGHTVRGGDIIFSSFIIDNIRSAIIPSNISIAVNKADCFLVRTASNKTNNKYLCYYFATKEMKNQLEESVHGATRPRINTTQLKSTIIPYCTILEQHKIVQAIEEKLSVVDKMEENITQSLHQTELIKQSTLKKAFEGKLAINETSSSN